MKRSSFQYIFKVVERCNMCGSHDFSILGRRLNTSHGLNPKRKVGLATTVLRCSNCGLVFSNPMPVPLSLDDHYGVDPKQYWKEEYFELDESYFATEIKWLQDLTDGVVGLKTLDIGAGLGKQMTALRRAGYDVYGFEPSKSFCNMARERFDFSEKRLRHSSIEDAEYPAEHFDFISFGAVLEHLYDPHGSIAKALKWLKSGGLIHIEVPNSSWLISRMLNMLNKMKGSDYVSNLSPMHVPYHLYEFSLKSFHKNGERQQYKVADHAYYVCDTFLPKIVDPIAKQIMSKTNTGMQLCVWLQKL